MDEKRKSLGLQVGDYVKLTGSGWNSREYGQSQNLIVRVDEVTSTGMARSNAHFNDDPQYERYNSLTDWDGSAYYDAYQVEKVASEGDEVITEEHTLTTAASTPQKIKVYWEGNVPLDKPENFLVLGLETTEANTFLSRADLDDLITVLMYAKTRIDGDNGD